MLKANDQINVDSNMIIYKNISFSYEIQCGEVTNKKNKYYHFRINCSKSEQLSLFEELLKIIRTIIYRATNRYPQIIWDDVSKYYSEMSYPLIYEIENLMRKLITKFMLTNVGIGWTKETLPREVMESIRNNNEQNIQNNLYEVDFIQLSNVLFKEYSQSNLKSFYEKLNKTNNINELNIDDLKLLIPKSNWERYFKPIVECEGEFLKKRWEKLYELRCKVAHNKFMSNSDYVEIVNLVNEVYGTVYKKLFR